jgi:hypothetical protein
MIVIRRPPPVRARHGASRSDEHDPVLPARPGCHPSEQHPVSPAWAGYVIPRAGGAGAAAGSRGEHGRRGRVGSALHHRTRLMCNLYSLISNQQAIRHMVAGWTDRIGNMPQLPGIFPDYAAPIVRNRGDTRELALVGWGYRRRCLRSRARRPTPASPMCAT